MASTRPPVVAPNGVVACAHPLAAIAFAENGFPLSPKNSTFIEPSLAYMDEDGKRNIAPKGRPPKTGEMIKQPELARTFHAVVEGGHDAFYKGPIAAHICADVQRR